MSTRILVRPEELVSLGRSLQQAAADLRAGAGRLPTLLAGLDWEVRQQAMMEEQAATAIRLASTLAAGAEGMSRYLIRKAEAFRHSDQEGLTFIAEAAATAAILQQQLAAALGQLSGVRAEAARWLAIGGAAAVPFAPGVGWAVRQFPHLFGPTPAEPGVITDPSAPPDTAGGSPFWNSVGPAPVVNGQFTPQFQTWVDRFNARIGANWQANPNDHVGNAGGDHLTSIYRLTPEKVERLWAFSQENHVDPRLMLAILQQEGTGSFNTNPANSAHYGGHGPQPDWDRDMTAALEGPILAKLRLYPHGVQAGFTGTWVQWINWHTPIDTEGFQAGSGVYAADINWGAGVERHYLDVAASLGSDGSENPVQAYSQWMGENSQLFQPRHVDGDFVIKPGLAPGADRPYLAVWGKYDKPEFPGTYGPVDGFWWFPAPDEYCWHLEKR